MASVTDVCKQLESALSAANVRVEYKPTVAASENGYFAPPRKRGLRARIVIRREHQQIPGDPLVELLTLAHEMGHWRSWTDGKRTDEYQASAMRFHDPSRPKLCAQECELILAEERLAFQLGREELQKAGFEAWSEYDAYEADAIAAYVTALGDRT